MTRRASRPRLALSATDLALLIVLTALVSAHLRAALSGSLVSLLFAAQHAAIAALTITHRPAGAHRIPSLDLLLAWGGTLLPLAMQPAPGGAAAALVLLTFGSVLATAAILSLGRSFGLEPADRGLQTRWCYRIVRHPIYAAYLLIIGGFLLSAPSWRNSLIALIWLGVQLARITREEALLSADPQYRRYMAQVRWRIVPGIW